MFTLRVLEWMAPLNRHVGPSKEDLAFLVSASIDPLEFLKKLKEAGLVNDPKGIFHESPDSMDFFIITQRGRDMIPVLKKIREAEQMANLPR